MHTQTPYESYQHAFETIDPVAQVMMLYSSAISCVRQAKAAIGKEDFDTKYQMIERAMAIMRGLRSCLDFTESPEIAGKMDSYYMAIDNLMVEVQCNDDRNTCDSIVEKLEKIKNTWQEINHYSAVFMATEDEPEERQNIII